MCRIYRVYAVRFYGPTGRLKVKRDNNMYYTLPSCHSKTAAAIATAALTMCMDDVGRGF